MAPDTAAAGTPCWRHGQPTYHTIPGDCGFAGVPYAQQPRTVGAAPDTRFSTLPIDTLRRILWAAKGAPCTCIQSAGGMGTGANPEVTMWVGPKWVCPRCTAIRDVCEAVPHVI